MIEFVCPNCGSEIQAQDSAAGKRGKCKSCDQVITVPSTESPGSAVASPRVKTGGMSPVLKYGLPVLGGILLYAVFMIATGRSRTERPKLATIPSDVSITVISQNSIRGKRVLDVRLSKRVSEDSLRGIAWKLKDADPTNAKRTFIAFYLPDMEVDAGAWATADFDPSLKLQILGASAAQEQPLAQVPPNPAREKMGSWLQDREPFPGKITLFRENASLYMEKTFTDGGIGKDLLVEQPSNDGRKFMKANRTRSTDDYYLIDRGGDFQIWSQDVDGSHVLVVTAKRID